MSPEAIDALISSGCTPEQIACAIRADADVEQKRLDEKRAARREPAQRRRAECEGNSPPATSRMRFSMVGPQVSHITMGYLGGQIFLEIRPATTPADARSEEPSPQGAS